MDSVTLEQIILIAGQESVELKHFYVGVEHLFLALTKLTGGVTLEILTQRGLLGYVLETMGRDTSGHSDDRRYWPDFHNTLRAERVISASRRAIEQGIAPDDRALLLAILDEGDSLPVRVFEELSTDINALRQAVAEWQGGAPVVAPTIPIEIDEPSLILSSAQERILREMFPDVNRIHVKRALQDGYSGAAVLLVQPVRQTLSYAPVVVKIDERQSIQYEKLRYDQLVKDILPPTSARIVDEPTLPADLAIGGIRYTFVHQTGADSPVNLRDYAARYGARNLSQFIRRALYDTFAEYWWGQNQPYHFQVWQEYELLLPAALVIELLPAGTTTPQMRTLYPKGPWSYRGGVNVGETVILEDFVAQKIKPDVQNPGTWILSVSAGAQSGASDRSSRVDVRGIDPTMTPFFRGQKIHQIVGRVIRTRNDLLQEQLQRLEPKFDIFGEQLLDPNGTLSLRNPLLIYPAVLEMRINGRLSPIHGDLHTGNILMGPAGDAWLIDFEWTRQGHTLFDWAVLETSLISELLVPRIGDSWDECWSLVRLLDVYNQTGKLPDGLDPMMVEAFEPIHQVRQIAAQLLGPNGLWSEYYIALGMCAIRVPSWKNRTVVTRRLMFLLSALCLSLAQVTGTTADSETLKTATDLHRTRGH